MSTTSVHHGPIMEAVDVLSGSKVRNSWLRWSTGGLAFSVAFAGALGALINPPTALYDIAGATAWWLFVSIALALGAPMLRLSATNERIDYYGIPNGITALRADACFPLFLCAILPLPHHWGFILWCTLGGSIALLDGVDGYIARRFGPITDLGKAFDPAMDVLFFSMAATGNVLLGIMPLWLALIVLSRYIGPLLATPLVFLAGRRPQLVHTVWGRRSTIVVGFSMFCLMWVRIFSGPTNAAAAVFAVLLIIPTTLLHFGDLFHRARQAPGAARDG